MRLLYIPLLLSIIFISSCQCHDYYKCITSSLQVNFVGFGPGETDTLIVKRYANDGTFGQLIDSSNKWTNASSADTFPSGIIVEEGYDYVISLPEAGIAHRISAIKSEGNYYENIRHSCFYKKLPLCTNRLLSYSLDGVNNNIPDNDNSFTESSIYIVK